MNDDQKAPYFDLEHEDRERFEQESAAADAERLAEQEANRLSQFVQAGENASSRGARKLLDEERQRKQEERERRRAEIEAEMSDGEREERRRLKEEKQRETEERQRKRAEEEKALKKQMKKLDKEQSKKAANRLEYLFKQSPIFAKLKMGKGSMDDEVSEKQKEEATKSKSGRGNGNGNGLTPKPHHIHDKDSAEEEEEEDEEEENHVFLTKQPSTIKHGQLKPYQLESLNWMIHLAEKGLNGILADEVGQTRDETACFHIHSARPPPERLTLCFRFLF